MCVRAGVRAGKGVRRSGLTSSVAAGMAFTHFSRRSYPEPLTVSTGTFCMTHTPDHPPHPYTHTQFSTVIVPITKHTYLTLTTTLIGLQTGS